MTFSCLILDRTVIIDPSNIADALKQTDGSPKFLKIKLDKKHSEYILEHSKKVERNISLHITVLISDNQTQYDTSAVFTSAGFLRKSWFLRVKLLNEGYINLLGKLNANPLNQIFFENNGLNSFLLSVGNPPENRVNSVFERKPLQNATIIPESGDTNGHIDFVLERSPEVQRAVPKTVKILLQEIGD